MLQFNISKSFEWSEPITDSVSAVMRMFGVTADRLRQNKIIHKCHLKINKADVVFFSGPSGSGKTVLLKELEKMIPPDQRINLQQIPLPSDKPVIDCLQGPLLHRLRSLSFAGLNDVFCILKTPAVLSEGQQWRFRLAMAMAENIPFIFADEFCSKLDPVTAAVVSYNIRKFADKNNITFVLAGSRTDFLKDLNPDVLIKKDFAGQADVIYKGAKNHEKM